MVQTPVNKFLENSVQTASPGQLLIMLYDGAIRFCRMGIAGIEEKNYAKASTSLGNVQRIVNELIITLDQKAPIAARLMPLYDYFNRRLIEANVKKDPKPAEEVLGYLVELRDTWRQAQIQVMSRRQSV